VKTARERAATAEAAASSAAEVAEYWRQQSLRPSAQAPLASGESVELEVVGDAGQAEENFFGSLRPEELDPSDEEPTARPLPKRATRPAQLPEQPGPGRKRRPT
jgi:hypothetical protein